MTAEPPSVGDTIYVITGHEKCVWIPRQVVEPINHLYVFGVLIPCNNNESIISHHHMSQENVSWRRSL